jgi:hypothetical protein
MFDMDGGLKMGKVYVYEGARYELEPEHMQHGGKDYVLAYPQGGGFQIRVPKDFFEEHFKEETDVKFRRFLFGGDWHPAMYYGWSDGSRWNGWAVPYVEEDVLKAIIAVQATVSDTPVLSMDGDVVVYTETDSTGVVEVFRYEPEEIEIENGKVKVWCLNFGWCFDFLGWQES